MKRFAMLGLAILLSVAMLGRAEAVPITGDITFGGTSLSSLNLGTTTVVDFDPQDAIVTSVIPGSSLDTTIDRRDEAIFKDFQFNPFVANNPLWTSGGFSFNLSSVTINTQNAMSLVLLGQGTMTGPAGFDDTPYEWSFSADRTRGVEAFSATNATAIPEPGTISLLGLGLLGLGWSRWRRIGSAK